MITTRALAACAVATLLVSGCGQSGADKDAKQPGAPETTTASSSSTPDIKGEETSLSQQELQAKIVADAAPKDLTWMVGKTPADWNKLETEGGVGQWQVGQTRCVVTFNQPAGVGTGKEPTSEQVLEREIQQTQSHIPATGEPKISGTDGVMVSNRVTGLDGSSFTKFAHTTVDYGQGMKGDFRALRNGDFALIATAVCGNNEFDKVFPGQIAPFLKVAAMRTTY